MILSLRSPNVHIFIKSWLWIFSFYCTLSVHYHLIYCLEIYVDKNQMNLIIKHKITFPFSWYCLISTFIQDLRLNLKLVPKFPFVPTWLVTRINPSEVTKIAGIRSPADQQLFSVAVNLSNSDQPFIWDSTQICSEITKYSPHFGNVATKLSFETFNNFTGS